MSSSKLLWLLPLFFLAACENGGSENHVVRERITSESASVSEEGAVPDTASRKIIRKADFSAKVPNVLKAVTELEMMVKSKGGFIEESRINNEQSATRTVAYKHDSLLQATIYTTTAHMTLRVPATQLDSVMYALPGLASHVESRTLMQDDVTLRYLGNKLKSETDVVTKPIQPRNTKDQITLQQYHDTRSEKDIDRKIENMGLLYDAEYATVTVALSQPEEAFVTHIVNPDQYTRLPVWMEFRDAFAGGLETCKALLLGLISIWPVVLLIVGIVVIVRRKKRRVVGVRA